MSSRHFFGLQHDLATSPVSRVLACRHRTRNRAFIHKSVCKRRPKIANLFDHKLNFQMLPSFLLLSVIWPSLFLLLNTLSFQAVECPP